MIEKFKDIDFDSVKTHEDMDKVLKENLGIGFAECTEALNQSVLERAQELIEDVPNIAPYGDYSKLIEDQPGMISFLETEVIKEGNWDFQFAEVKKDQDQLMELCFFNKAVDDGDIMKGFVFIGLSGKIRHAFAQINT